MSRCSFWGVLFCGVVIHSAWSGAVPSGQGELTGRQKNLARVRTQEAEQAKAHGGNINFMLRPGLLADKTGRVVRVAAESISLSPGSPVEFPLITASSGKDYEAHAVSFASAWDVHEALKFIGLQPGHGVDPTRLRFWPRGDRVAITFHYRNQAGRDQHIPATRLTVDSRTGKTLPETGFVFTGSEWIEVDEPATGRVYSADAFSPNCIISHYNEPTTVLDVPRRDSQNSVYSYQVPNPEFLLPSNQLIEITLEPYYRDGLPHSFEFMLTVAPGNSTGSVELVYTLLDPAGQVVNTQRTLPGVLDALEKYSGPEIETYVTFVPDESLPVASLQKVVRLLDKLDAERGLRIEAPLKGHPYFRAFLPNEQHRKREDRPSLAAELFLETGSAGITGTLVLVDMDWKGSDSAPTFSETRLAIASADKLVPALTSKESVPAVVLIFVPVSMTYGSFRAFIEPLLQRKTILYVFLK